MRNLFLASMFLLSGCAQSVRMIGGPEISMPRGFARDMVIDRVTAAYSVAAREYTETTGRSVHTRWLYEMESIRLWTMSIPCPEDPLARSTWQTTNQGDYRVRSRSRQCNGLEVGGRTIHAKIGSCAIVHEFMHLFNRRLGYNVGPEHEQPIFGPGSATERAIAEARAAGICGGDAL